MLLIPFYFYALSTISIRVLLFLQLEMSNSISKKDGERNNYALDTLMPIG